MHAQALLYTTRTYHTPEAFWSVDLYIFSMSHDLRVSSLAANSLGCHDLINPSKYICT